MDKPYHLALLARAPTPGRSKTRLIPRLGEKGAASFAEAALIDILHLFSKLTSCRRILFYTPASSRPGLYDLLSREGLNEAWDLLPQPETGDLGDRLSSALEYAYKSYRHNGNMTGLPVVTFIGMDCFDLTPDSVQDSMRRVSEARGKAHMIPACDGGYVLLTVPLNSNGNALFSGIEWSTDQTGDMQTRTLDKAGLHCELEEALPDVDEPADLDRLWRDHKSKAQEYRNTMKFLSEAMSLEAEDAKEEVS